MILWLHYGDVRLNSSILISMLHLFLQLVDFENVYRLPSRFTILVEPFVKL